MQNSNYNSTIDHPGIVQNVDEKSVTVIIASETACSGCHAEGSCNISGKENKIIEVSGNYNVLPGDNVRILMKKSMGYKALLLGYLLPLVIVVGILIVLIASGVSESLAGSLAIATILPYYLILYIFRKQVNDQFTFTLKV